MTASSNRETSVRNIRRFWGPQHARYVYHKDLVAATEMELKQLFSQERVGICRCRKRSVPGTPGLQREPARCPVVSRGSRRAVVLDASLSRSILDVIFQLSCGAAIRVKPKARLCEPWVNCAPKTIEPRRGDRYSSGKNPPDNPTTLTLANEVSLPIFRGPSCEIRSRRNSRHYSRVTG